MRPIWLTLRKASRRPCALSRACAGSAWAQSINVDLGQSGGTVSGQILRLVLLVTVLSLAPSILVMVTSFTRIVIVLSFLRTAIGLQQTPPNSVLVGLALFLTVFVMSPTLETVYRDGLEPLLAEEIDESEALRAARSACGTSCCSRCGRTTSRCSSRSPGWSPRLRWPRCRCACSCRPS